MIFFLVILAFRLLFRFLFVRFMKKWQSKMNPDFNQEQKKEGEVTIKGAEKKNKSSILKDEGDYVDYEEV